MRSAVMTIAVILASIAIPGAAGAESVEEFLRAAIKASESDFSSMRGAKDLEMWDDTHHWWKCKKLPPNSSACEVTGSPGSSPELAVKWCRQSASKAVSEAKGLSSAIAEVLGKAGWSERSSTNLSDGWLIENRKIVVTLHASDDECLDDDVNDLPGITLTIAPI